MAAETTTDTIAALCEALQVGNQNTRAEAVRALVELYSGVWSGAWFLEQCSFKLGQGVMVVEKFTTEDIVDPPIKPVPVKLTTHRHTANVMNTAKLDALVRTMMADPYRLIADLVSNVAVTRDMAVAAGGVGPFVSHVYTTKPRLHLKLDDEYGDDRVVAYSAIHTIGWVSPKSQP